MAETITLDISKIEALKNQGFRMVSHSGSDGSQGCAMDVIAWSTTGEWTDMPSCVHPTLSRFVQRLNDTTDNVDFRWRLALECGPLLVGTDDWTATKAARVVARAGQTVAGLREALETTADSADLSGADLSYADLRSANLRSANLSYADLSGADLSYANLSYADLRSAFGNEFTVLPAGWKVTASGLVVKDGQ